MLSVITHAELQCVCVQSYKWECENYTHVVHVRGKLGAVLYVFLQYAQHFY